MVDCATVVLNYYSETIPACTHIYNSGDKEFILNQVKATGPAMVDGFFLQEETVGSGHHVKYTYQGSDPCEINVNPGIPFSPLIVC